MSDPSLVNDLRLRVLNKEEITADEMLLIVEQIRANRRSAAAAAKPTKEKKKATSTRMTSDEKDSLLDMEI